MQSNIFYVFLTKNWESDKRWNSVIAKTYKKYFCII